MALSNYTPFFLADEIAKSGGYLKAAAIRKDYSRMRKIAQKRLKRFEGTEWVNTEVYKYNVNRFRRLDQIKSAGELAYLTADLYRFLQSETGTITGLKKQRKATIAKMHEKGYTFITNANFIAFTQFMQALRSAGIARLYDSERLGHIFAEEYEEGVPPEELSEKFKQYTAAQIAEGRADSLYHMSIDDMREVAENANSRTTPKKNTGRNRKR